MCLYNGIRSQYRGEKTMDQNTTIMKPQVKSFIAITLHVKLLSVKTPHIKIWSDKISYTCRKTAQIYPICNKIDVNFYIPLSLKHILKYN